MQMQLLKIAVVLLVAGSGDARPQASGADSATQMETSDAGWTGVHASNKSHDIVRDDSRYTRTSGNNRKSYITSYFRGNVDSSRERNAIGSRASGSARNGTARASLNARRSGIDRVWTTPELRTDAPLDLPRSELGRIAEDNVARNSNETGRSSLHDIVDNSRSNRDGNIAPSKSALALNDGSATDRKNHSEATKVGFFEKDPMFVGSRNFRSVITPVSFAGENNFSANHASSFGRQSDGSATDRWKSDSISPSSILSEGVDDDTARWKIKRPASVFSFQATGTNVPSNPRWQNAAADSIHVNRRTIREGADNKAGSAVTPYGDLKPAVIGDSPRRADDSVRRGDGLNNSEKPATEALRSTLIPNSKSEVDGNRFASIRRNRLTSKRSFVRLRYPFSSSSAVRRNASNILNTINRLKLKNDNTESAILRQSTEGPTRTAARRPGLKDRTTSFESTKNRDDTSFAQKSPSQATDRVHDANEGTDEYNGAYSKNWPNEALQNVEDLYNYEKYTSSLKEQSSHDESSSFYPHLGNSAPIVLSPNGGYVNRPDPFLDSSVQKIIQWLRIPTIVPNDTRLADKNVGDDNVHKPIESVLESIYENLDPNRPLNHGDHDENHGSEIVLQEASQSQDTDDGMVDYHEDYPIRWSSSVVRPQFTGPSSGTLTWSDVASLRNKTVFKPTTHVTQNTVVHILNDGLKRPNVTVTQLNTPEEKIDQAASSGDGGVSAESPVTFTSQKNEAEKNAEMPAKQETLSSSSADVGANCPTITINTYTRVNNTIQSKEGCTDLNIIVNSHVLNTNVFKPSGGPTDEPMDQSTSSATESLDDADGSDKYADDDLSHQDSSVSHVTASAGTYSPSPLELPGSIGENHDSQKDPIQDESVSSTLEVFQGTQISVIGSVASLADSAATVGPADLSGSSVDGPAAGDGGISGSPVASGSIPSLNNAAGTVMGQSNNALGTLQLPARPNLPIKPVLSIASGSSSSQPASSGSSSVSNDDDEDEDEDEDISPGGVLHSIASVFTYFSFMNPVGYSFFSLAAAPFAAMAAGVLGVAAVVFPWALPNVLNLGRAVDTVPSLEEFVRRAVRKYDRLNEWKSRRRKRRR